MHDKKCLLWNCLDAVFLFICMVGLAVLFCSVKSIQERLVAVQIGRKYCEIVRFPIVCSHYIGLYAHMNIFFYFYFQFLFHDIVL